MTDSDFGYYARRAQQQAMLAKETACMKAVRAHYELVRRYTALALRART